MKAVVWTQPGCSYCTKVKTLLSGAGYEIEERDIGPKGSAERDEFKMFVGETTPQVFLDGVQIGTYEDTVKWFEGAASCEGACAV